MHWMILPLRRYAEFSGRSRRTEYWMFALLQIIVLVALGGVVSTFGAEPQGAGVGLFGITVALVFLALIIPNIAVQVRRYHDQDRSGWFVLLNFIPYVGSLIVLVFMLLPGTEGPNRFGADPKQTAMEASA